MPYIKVANREYFDEMLAKLGRCSIANAGELNYLITELINQYHVTHTKSYQIMNDIVGALESCKAEYQRRIVAPYEDKKRTENEDVYNEETLR